MRVPETMSAAVYREQGRLEVVDLAVPALGPREVLVEVDSCGVCGSDLHAVLEGWGVPGSVEGHEYAGVVAGIGPEVTRWRVGDEVVGGPSPGCGECAPCLAGRAPLCLGRGNVGVDPMQGGFARFTRLDEQDLLAVPKGLGLREAALTEPLSVALHGITLAEVEPGHRVIVFGCGPIGALTVAVLVARGVADLTVVEPGRARQALARSLGAAAVVAPDELPEPGWHPGHVLDEPFDRAIECSGARSAMEAALGQLGRLGRLVLVGAGVHPPRFDTNRIMLNELAITGAFTYDQGGFEAALALLASGALPTQLLLEPGAVALDGLLEAMQRLAAGELAGKVLVSPGGAG